MVKLSNPRQEPPAPTKAPNQDLMDMDVFWTFKMKIECWNLKIGYMKDQWPYPNQEQDAKPQSEISKETIGTKLTWIFFAPSKSRWRAKIWIMCVSKTSDHIGIKIKMPYPSQEPPSSKALNQDLRDMDVLCPFNIKIESQNSDHGCIKYHWLFQNQD